MKSSRATGSLMGRVSLWAGPASLALTALFMACGGAPGGEDDAPTDPTLETYARSVLAALSDWDGEALDELRLTESEHNREIWPALPAARGETGFPVAEAWDNIQRRNERAQAVLFRYFGGRTAELRSARCTGVQDFEGFRVRTGCFVVFEFGDGRVFEAVLFKDLVEREGDLRAFRFYDEPGPRALVAVRHASSAGERNR